MDKKRSGAVPAATETTPMTKNPECNGFDQKENLPQKAVNVKSERSRAEQLRWLLLRIGGTTETVEEIRKIYPKFDKSALSKAKNADSYGLELCSDALQHLWQKYAPEEYARRKRHSDGHKLTKRLQCRVDDKTYEMFHKKCLTNGFRSTNDCLAMLVRMYVQKKI